MTKRWVLGFLIFWSSLWGVFADGKVFPPTAYPLPDIPEQQALIHYANGIEKLVIKTSFTGQGTNFAWIVPLPTVPKIEPVTTGLFPTLQFQFRPEVKHIVEAWFGGLIALYALIRLLWKTSATGKMTLADWLSCLAFGGGIGLLIDSPWPLIALTLPMLLAVQRVRQGTENKWAVLWMFLIVAALSSLLLPALSTAGVSVASTGSVIIHGRQTVGSYETVVISAQKADELMDWLKSNSFAAPAEITPVVADYLKDGWVFAAARLARTEQKGSSAIHPLMFTFPTKKPVYPMRLTGVGNGNLKVDLYVFGAQRAKAQNFTVSRCAQATYPATNNYYSDTVRHLYVGHSGLSNIVEKAAVATKLQATLTPAQMQQDVWLGWEPFQAHQDVFYSHQGAWITALNYVVALLLLGLFVQDFERVQKRLGSAHLMKFRLSLFLITSVSALAIIMTLPQVEVRLTKSRPYSVKQFHFHQQLDLALELNEITETNHSLVVSSWLAEKLESRLKGKNPLTGQPYQQEDSPGNYRIEARTNGFDYLWYDRNGFEHKITYPKTDDR